MILAAWWMALYLLLVGLSAGWLAWVVLGKNKALSKGSSRPNWGLLLVLGLVGSFAGGLGISLLLGQGFALHPSGMIGSVIGAIGVSALYVWLKER